MSGCDEKDKNRCNDSYILPQSLNTHTYDIRTHTHTHTHTTYVHTHTHTHIRGMSDGFRGMLMMVLLLYKRESNVTTHTHTGYTHGVSSSGVALPSDSPPPPVWAEHL